MIEVFLLLAALAGATYASYSDIKHGIIPNRLAFSLIFLGLGSYTAYSVYLKDYGLMMEVLKSFTLIFILGYLFWFVGGWSAGDAKEFMFLAALVPKYPEALKTLFKPVIAPYPFSLTMLLNTFLLVFPFIALYSLLLTYPRVGLRGIMEPLFDYKKTGAMALIVTAAYSVGGMFQSRSLAVFILILLILLRNSKIQVTVAAVLAAASAIAAGGYVSVVKGYLFLFSLIIALRFFIHLIALFLKKGLRREVRITELEEGMIPGEEIYQENGDIKRDARIGIERWYESLKKHEVNKRDTLVQGGAAGLTKEEVKRLQGLVREGRLEDKIIITRGIPFAPAILLGFTASLIIGDLTIYLWGSI